MPIIPKPETKENNCQDVCKEKEKNGGKSARPLSMGERIRE